LSKKVHHTVYKILKTYLKNDLFNNKWKKF